MTTYVDSSALVAIYVPERFSNGACQTVRGVPQVPFTQLHELEVSNAFVNSPSRKPPGSRWWISRVALGVRNRDRELAGPVVRQMLTKRPETGAK